MITWKKRCDPSSEKNKTEALPEFRFGLGHAQF
jgi:hypothetical protein